MRITRLDAGKQIARAAGEMALEYFRDIGALKIESKGAQDFVSNADTEVESFVRARLAELFPQDGIIGEEHAPVPSKSGWTWVIDPIDGTANFVSGIPQWCVILACVSDDKTQVAVIYEPSADEMFWAEKGSGAFMNGKPMRVSETEGLHQGTVGVGMNGRTDARITCKTIELLAAKGGIFFRNASGGLMLSYVAAGRLIGYTEPHMNAWDCLAGQLLIAEAGGVIEDQSATEMLAHGGRVFAGCPAVFDDLVVLSLAAENV